jgi:ADP-ribosylation factor-like protein 2
MMLIDRKTPSYKLNIWDVGGQKTLRSYWRNYFEKTDALIWVVDATDRFRLDSCAEELAGLLQQERLLGASLLVFANKMDADGCMTLEEIRTVCSPSIVFWGEGGGGKS